MVFPAMAACLLLAWSQMRYQLALRTETKTLPDGAGDLKLDPLLSVEAPSRSLQLSARYLPTILLREPRERGTFNLLNRGLLSGTLRLSKDRRVLAEQRVAHGPTDLSWLALASGVPPRSGARSCQLRPQHAGARCHPVAEASAAGSRCDGVRSWIEPRVRSCGAPRDRPGWTSRHCRRWCSPPAAGRQ